MAQSRRNPPSTKKPKTRRSQHFVKEEKTHSWAVVRSLLTCKHLQVQQQQQQVLKQEKGDNNKECKKMKCYYSGSSICSNTKVTQRSEASPQKQRRKLPKVTLDELNNNVKAVNNSTCSSQRGGGLPNFRKLSGCYECRMVIDPGGDPCLRCSCPHCGEIFMKPQHLELHQAVRHAVSELGEEDTSRNIVEIIFQSSWLTKKMGVCKIDRILKIHNTPTTISRFEEYRDTIKSKAKATTNNKKQYPRCIADGNELLRFHCTTFLCSLGLNGSSNLCTLPHCNACSIIKNGFNLGDGSILTTATSGKAHDNTRAGVSCDDDDKRAMLVCRVIAGRVKENNLEEYDSIAAGPAGVYSNLDELYVFNHRAILPCFVVIYKGF